MNFLKYKYVYFVFSGILVLASIVFLFVFGLNLGIDFTGGSILEIEYLTARPLNEEIKQRVADLDLGSISVQSIGENGIIIRMKDIPENIHQELVRKLSEGHEIEEQRFESIGPTIGQELKDKTKVLILVALFSIVLYIAFSFRKVHRPVSSWQYGLVALIALFHDVLLPLAVFSILGKLYGVQITIPVVAALLTILGYSINNTVVVFDRIRENLIQKTAGTFEETINISLNQTLSRCINTSLTTLLALFAIFFFGGSTLRYFSLTLIIGIMAGTYSSIFLASPLLVLRNRS
ncbi:MAG: protein translocase subunit SecF [Candidatus Nealsonbacteria bacterium]|nr:protein translocase subunit SecF [Candidatus Nealsonbacteria bacterium]